MVIKIPIKTTINIPTNKVDKVDNKKNYKKVCFLDDIVKGSVHPFSCLPQNFVVYYIKKSKITESLNINIVNYKIKTHGFKSVFTELKRIITWMKHNRYPDQIIKIEKVISKISSKYKKSK
jgi:hypothetical protein